MRSELLFVLNIIYRMVLEDGKKRNRVADQSCVTEERKKKEHR
jgi:hypothetical protein